LFVTHPFDLKKRLHIFLSIDPLAPTTFLRLKKLELRFPEPQHIGRKTGDPTDLSDLVKEFIVE